jgi:hypothetical protein
MAVAGTVVAGPGYNTADLIVKEDDNIDEDRTARDDLSDLCHSKHTRKRGGT